VQSNFSGFLSYLKAAVVQAIATPEVAQGPLVDFNAYLTLWQKKLLVWVLLLKFLIVNAFVHF
jgi:hypothetical protein